MNNDEKIQAILQFWFGEPNTETTSYNHRRKLWFSKRPEFDALIQSQFRSVYEQAAKGELADWQRFPLGCLALVILLDQFPRNMFRDTPQAFATDPQALHIAQQAIEQGFDRQLEPIQRIFIYLPFEHSETLDHQRQSVERCQQLYAEAPELADVLDYALRHQKVIERFGRFPHRNRILGRENTPEETKFLQQPGSAF